MKSIIVPLTFAFFISFASFAQIIPGTYVIGGSTTFNLSNIPDN